MSGIALAQLGEIADLQAGVGFPVDLQGRSSGDYPVAKVGDISRVGRSGEAVISAADHYIDVGDLARLRARPIPAGSVLFAKIGEAIRQNHRVIAGCALLVDNNAMAAVPTKRVESRYLYHYLRTVDFYGLASATTVPALRKSDLERLPVPLPPLPEQRRIVEVLDKADTLRAKRRAALTQLDTLTQSIFLEMFGDPISNPMKWPTTRFEDICERVTVGIVVQPASYYVSEGVPALRSLNIRPGKIVLDDLVYFSESDNETKLAKTKLKTGDVVLVRSGQPGTAAVVPGELDGINAIDLLIATPDQQLANPTFLCEFFNSAGGRDLVLSRQRGQVQKHLNVGSLNQAILPLPCIDLQREFAARVAAVEKHWAVAIASSKELGALFKSLQHRAFRGEL